MDINEFTQIQKDTILGNDKDQMLFPTLLINSEDGKGCVMVLTDFGKDGDREGDMRCLGAEYRERQDSAPTSIFFAAEAWVSTVEAGQSPKSKPSEDPNKVECLMIEAYDIKAKVGRLVGYEIKRDSEGIVESFDKKWDSADNKKINRSKSLIESFLIGYEDEK